MVPEFGGPQKILSLGTRPGSGNAFLTALLWPELQRKSAGHKAPGVLLPR